MRYQVVVKFFDVQKEKEVAETYLFEATSYSDAEFKSIEKLSPELPSDFAIDSITKLQVSDIIGGRQKQEDDKFYIAKNTQIQDTDNGPRKKTLRVLVKALSVKSAVDLMDAYNQGFVDHTYLSAITETAIIEVFYQDSLEAADSQPVAAEEQVF